MGLPPSRPASAAGRAWSAPGCAAWQPAAS